MFTKNKNAAAALVGGGNFASRLLSGGFAAFMMVLMLSATSAQAATPVAGTLIINTAHATYNNATGTPQTPVDSNPVTTSVLPVGAYTLDTSQAFAVSRSETKHILHTVTNTGNVADIFHITLPNAVPSSLTSVVAIRDDNNNGIWESGETTVLCTVSGANTCAFDTTSVAPNGGAYNFFLKAIVAPTANNGDIATADVIAKPATPSVFAVPSITNTDTLTVSATVFGVTKSITTATSGTWNSVAGQTVTYKLHYQNTGTAPGPLYLKDTIGVADPLNAADTTGFTYKAGTGIWSVGNLTLTDAVDADGAGITYQAQAGGGGEIVIQVAIASVAAGASGDIIFSVQVANSSITGTLKTTNVGYFGNTATPTSPTNLASFDVLVSGLLSLQKYQSLANWNGATCDVAGTYVQTDLGQVPGACIWYKIVATNNTTSDATTVAISDSTPTTTTYANGAACTAGDPDVAGSATGVTGTPVLANPAAGTVGSVGCNAWTLIPATKAATLNFAVRINP